jgi:putative ABC transport system permease protein
MRTGFLPWLARGIVRLAALRAPADRRREMLAEWEAELDREFSTGRRWSAVGAAFGAFADAAALSDLESTETRRSGRTMGDGFAGIGDDLRTALRALLRVPGFTGVTVVTLAVGIGGASAIYTLLDRVVMDPLPYPQSERLIRMENRVPAISPDERWQLSTAQWVHYSNRARTLEEVGLFRTLGGNVSTASGAVRVRGVRVTASTMRMLGADARLGRVIGEEDDRPDAPQVVMLAHDFWTSAFGSDPDVVGRTILFNDVPFAVIGVLASGVSPPGLPIGAEPDVWTTLNIDREAGPFNNNHVFPGMARLAPGATAAEAEAELDRLALELPDAFPSAYSEGFIASGFRTAVTPLKEHVVGDLARNLWLLFAGVALVLLIAAANVANLFLVRVEGKRRELGIRAALGAGRGRVARFLLAEGLTLALLGGGLALLVGYWAVPAMTALAPPELPRIQGVGVGLGTVGFTVVVSLFVGLLIAVVPMVEGSRTGAEILGEAGRATTAGRAQRGLRSVLVVVQMALALTLVVVAGMLLQTLDRLHATDPGFEPEGVLAVDLHLTQVRYPDDADLWGFYRTALERIRAIPGVASAGLGEGVPVSGGYGCTVQGFEEEVVYQRLNDAGHTTCAGQLRITPGYFEALRIELVEGRLLARGDLEDPTRAAVVVSRAAADRFWPGESAIGKGIGAARSIEPWHRVVGVVEDVKRASDDGLPPLSQTAIAVYYPVVDNPDVPGNWWWWPGDMTLVVRADGVDAASLLPAVRQAVSSVDPEVPIANARLMADVVADALIQVTFMSLLLSLAAAVALTLAAIGLYGVVSYVVSRRTREIGMRLAIGAQPRTVERMVVGQTVKMLAVGLVVGIPLAMGAARVGSTVLIGVEPSGATTYLAAAAVMTLITLLAAWLPARRAAAVDPVEALRSE